jgi:hypothetical protein
LKIFGLRRSPGKFLSGYGPRCGADSEFKNGGYLGEGVGAPLPAQGSIGRSGLQVAVYKGNDKNSQQVVIFLLTNDGKAIIINSFHGY